MLDHVMCNHEGWLALRTMLLHAGELPEQPAQNLPTCISPNKHGRSYSTQEAAGIHGARQDLSAQGVDPEEGNTRAINRHRYSIAEADEALQQPVVQALLTLCKARNTHPAFNGQVCRLCFIALCTPSSGAWILPAFCRRPEALHDMYEQQICSRHQNCKGSILLLVPG